MRITELTNEVYAVAEAGLWIDGATRTTLDEVVELTRAGQIAVARLSGRVVGCVRVQRLEEDTGELAMLVADPRTAASGWGASWWRSPNARAVPRVRTMRLELLVPRDWTHPVKAFLDSSYTRMGYRIARTGAIDYAYPALAPLLATPCDFLIYHKPLMNERVRVLDRA